MRDRQTIENAITMNQSCLPKAEKEVVYKLYKYSGTFHVRDEVEACPVIEVDLHIYETNPFLYDLFILKEEDKPMIDNAVQRFVHLGLPKQDISLYSSVILITRKKSKLKRIFADFRFLNSRLQRVNLAFPVIREAFAIF